jgi:hypothetical protein
VGDRPDRGAAIEHDPQPGAPADEPGDDEFWSLAKKGLAAWGHEPTTDEIVGYWRGLIDDERREAAVLAPDPAIATLAALVGLAPPVEPVPVPGAVGGVTVALSASWAPAPDEPVEVLGRLLALGRRDPDDTGVEAWATAVTREMPAVTAEAVEWLAVPLAAVPAPLARSGGRRWWRVAAARPRPDPEIGLPAPPAVGRGDPPAVEVVEGAGRVGLGGGGLAFADALGLLERRRRVQQGRRRWGRHIALPVPPLDAHERELRHGVDVAGAERLELALRAAAAGAGDQGLPAVHEVVASADEVEVRFGDGGRWVDGEGATGGGDPDRVLPPLPLLAPLGRTSSGRERLVDLESRGVTTVDGAPGDVLGLLRSTVVAMATAAWCTPLRIVAVGLGRELNGLPGVESVDSLDVALTYAEARVHQVRSALEALGETSVRRVRAAGLSSSAAGALLVVCARPPDDTAVGARVAALAEQGSSGVGVLLRHPPHPTVDLPGTPSRLRIDPDGRLAAAGVGGDTEGDDPTWARRLDAVDARRLVDLLTVAARRDDGDTAIRPRRSRPDDEDPMDGVDVLVRVLGDVGLDRTGERAGAGAGAGAETTAATDPDPAALEVLAYLALRESSVTHATLEASLFPDGVPGPHALEARVTAAIELAGPGIVQRPTPGRFAVSDRIATDHGLLCDLVSRADEAVAAGDLPAAAELLARALDLVRAAPLAGPGRRYSWAGPVREAIVAQVVDAADSLACLRARADDWPAVDRAAAQGLRAAPGAERLHRWRMRAAHAAGEIDRVHELFEEACDAVADPAIGIEPEDTLRPETVQLLEALVARRSAGEPIAPAEPAEPAEPGEVRRFAPDRPLPVTEELPEVAATRPPDALIA